ncbi:MAG TPA: dTMP kinase [candidate division Zixibacteria bacterium]|nr:dTMP kinase [candidate division Zixibacteria bacterium]
MPPKFGKRLFVTFEGIDGCGKSTQAMLCFQLLTKAGYKVKMLREPGSTVVSEKIREILLDSKHKITDLTELLLYEAARAEITAREIAPALADGQIVLCDRFYDSTTAYQGFGRKLDIRVVKGLNKVATGGVVPDLTFVFDVDLKTAQARRGKRKDRLESQSKAFFERVRVGFLEIARKERRRVKLIDASRPVEIVFQDVRKILLKKLSR